MNQLIIFCLMILSTIPAALMNRRIEKQETSETFKIRTRYVEIMTVVIIFLGWFFISLRFI